MDNEPGSLPYAKRKLCDAVYALIGTATIDRRLTYAASYLMLLQPRDLPAGMRDDFEKLLRKLTRIPLSWATACMPRPISDCAVCRLQVLKSLGWLMFWHGYRRRSRARLLQLDDNAQDTRRLVIETNGIRQSKAEMCIWRDPLRGSSIHEGRLRLVAD